MKLVECFAKYEKSTNCTQSQYINEVFIITQNKGLKGGVKILTNKYNEIVSFKIEKIQNKKTYYEVGYIGYTLGSGIYKYELEESNLKDQGEFIILNSKRYSLIKYKKTHFSNSLVYNKDGLIYENKKKLVLGEIREIREIKKCSNFLKYEEEFLIFFEDKELDGRFGFFNFILQAENLDFLFFYVFYTPKNEVYVFSSRYYNSSMTILILFLYQNNKIEDILDLNAFEQKFSFNFIDKKNNNSVEKIKFGVIEEVENLKISPKIVLYLVKSIFLEKQIILFSKYDQKIYSAISFAICAINPFKYQFFVKSFCTEDDFDILEMPFPFIVGFKIIPNKICPNQIFINLDENKLPKNSSMIKFPYENSLKSVLLLRNHKKSFLEYFTIVKNNLDIARERQMLRYLNAEDFTNIQILSEYPEKSLDLSLKKEKIFYENLVKTQTFKNYSYSTFLEVDYTQNLLLSNKTIQKNLKIEGLTINFLKMKLFLKVFPYLAKDFFFSKTYKDLKDDEKKNINKDIFRSLSFLNNFKDIVIVYKQILMLNSEITPLDLKSINLYKGNTVNMIKKEKILEDSEKIRKEGNFLYLENLKEEFVDLNITFLNFYNNENINLSKKNYLNFIFFSKDILKEILIE